MASHAQLHNKIVYQLLSTALSEYAPIDVAFNIDVNERACPAERHSRSVLLLDCGKICKVKPLNRLARVACRRRYVIAVHLRHLLEHFHKVKLFLQFLAQPYDLLCHILIFKRDFICLFKFDKRIHTVEGNSAIVSYYPASSVGVGQTGEQRNMACLSHLTRIGSEYSVVVSCLISELVLDFIGQLIAVSLCRLTRHAHTAEGIYTSAQGAVGLKTHDKLLFLVKITGRIGDER